MAEAGDVMDANPAEIEAAVAAALERLSADRFVAYPTETVWGLGACADRAPAVDRLLAWKGRGSNAPLAVLAATPAQVEDLGCSVDARVSRLIAGFWPGPLMLVLPCAREFAPGVAGTAGALGVRCSPHPLSVRLATALADAGLGPLTSTSLNRTGSPPAETRSDVATILAGAADGPETPWLVQAGSLDAGGERPSTVVDCTGESLVVLREGAIATERVEAVAEGDAP